VLRTLDDHGQELLPCDLVARLRDHLVGVLMPDIDARDAHLQPARGTVSTLVYPADRGAMQSLAKRMHPLLKPPAMRAGRTA
jgi:hypothetical protein